jgi:hypothetical protein
MRIFGGSTAGSQSIVADDAANASAYGGGLSTGNNAGYGFSDWNVINSGTGGNFIGSSTASGLGDINVAGESWGMFGSNGGSNGCNLRRNIRVGNQDTSLSVGFALSAVVAVGFRDGNKGMDLYTSSNWTSPIFNFNIGGTYTFDGLPQNGTGGQPNWTYSQQNVFEIIARQTTTSNINFTVRSRVFPADTNSVNKTGALRGFQFYCYNTTGGSANDFFANSLDVYRY